jgi:uncharacterized protein
LVSISFEVFMGFDASSTPAQIAAALQASMIYVGLLVLLGVALSIPVMIRRRTALVGLGDGGDKELLRRMRIHGNFIEQATLGLPVLILLPSSGAPVLIVHLAGASLLISRLLHAQGLFQSSGISFGRVAGMSLSWIGLIGGAIAIMAYALSTGTALHVLFPG